MGKKRVLIADDNQLMHQVYMEYLGDEFEYQHCYDGAETLLMAVDLMPDLILLDLLMPLLDGRSICKKLKSYPKTREIKVVMVTTRDSQFDRLVGFESGADDYVEKPSLDGLLVRSVRKQLY